MATTDRPRRRRGLPRWLVPSAALALFAVVALMLAAQMRAGRDPALGAGRQFAGAPSTLVRVERRVIYTRIRRIVIDDDGQAHLVTQRVPVTTTSSGPAITSSSSSSGASAPVSASPAPAAPAAPIVTRTS